MSDYKFKEVDFSNPSIPFIIEDWFKNLLGGNIIYKSYFESITINGNESILDFGCGGGTGSKVLAEMLKKGYLTCVDTSKHWTEKARKRLERFSNVKVICGDIRQIDIHNKSFDLISIIHVIHDIPPSERQETIKALAENLKENGKLFVREPVKISHGISKEELESLMKNAGLKRIKHQLNKREYKGEFEFKFQG